jgi:hypothetical protein
VPGRALRLYLLVERGKRKSTCDLRIFRVAYHPETPSGGPIPPSSPFSRTAAPEFDNSSNKFCYLRTLDDALRLVILICGSASVSDYVGGLNESMQHPAQTRIH